MITNLIIRIVSLAICLCLLAGGAIISFNLSKDNPEINEAIQKIKDTPWVPGFETLPEETTATTTTTVETPSEDEIPSEDEVPSEDEIPSEDEVPQE